MTISHHFNAYHLLSTFRRAGILINFRYAPDLVVREKNMMKTIFTACALAAALFTTAVSAGETPSPEGAELYFINLKDGDTVSNPVTIQFGLKGMGVAPAGTEKENTGHHHLLINEALEGEELNEPIPADEQHIHFGGGQTETTLDLPTGTHTLQLVLGDWTHIPHNPPVMSDRITITVE